MCVSAGGSSLCRRILGFLATTPECNVSACILLQAFTADWKVLSKTKRFTKWLKAEVITARKRAACVMCLGGVFEEDPDKPSKPGRGPPLMKISTRGWYTFPLPAKPAQPSTIDEALQVSAGKNSPYDAISRSDFEPGAQIPVDFIGRIDQTREMLLRSWCMVELGAAVVRLCRRGGGESGGASVAAQGLTQEGRACGSRGAVDGGAGEQDEEVSTDVMCVPE